jgi:hypothetical protein
MDVYLVNESTTMSETDAWRMAWAIDHQARYQFGRSGWRPDVRCTFLPGGGAAKVPVGGSILHLLDTADVQGALGYHDEDGNEVPYAKVFVKTAQDAGDPVSEVASHELLELAVDPHCNLSALTGDGKRLYALEVGDPVQGTAYDVGAPEGRTTGIIVANFALPAFFDPSTKAAKVDFRGALSAPFTLTKQGYMSYVDMANASPGWQQEFGQERTAAPTWAYRHDQRSRTSPAANSG